MTRLHLGCGKKYMPGYVHIDLNDFDHIDYKLDIRKLPVFRSNSVDLIYFCHGIEYFDRVEINQVLSEWRRVLKSSGTLRLAMPDFEALSNLYNDTKDLSLVAGQLFGRWELKDGSTFYHRTTYDFNTLYQILTKNGFNNIRRWDWREVFINELEGYDDYSKAYYPHMDFENGKLLSLNVECEKGEK